MFGFNSNIDEVIERFKALGPRMENIDPTDALLVGVNAARGQMSFRIFNKGQDAEEITLGIYTGKKKGGLPKKSKLLDDLKVKTRIIGEQLEFTEYELKRLGKGRQVRYKDLEFTGTLRRAIRAIKESNIRVVCIIDNEEMANIANYQEEQIGKIRGGGKAVIFALSKSERELLRSNTVAALKQLYVRVFNT